MRDQRHIHSSLSPFVFAGSYEDEIGVEEITWFVKPSTRRSPPDQSGFELWTTIRGVPFWGYDLDGLEAEDPALAASQGFHEGDLSSCVLSGALPCVVEEHGTRTVVAIPFRLELPARDPARPDNLRLSLAISDQKYEVVDESFEGGVLALARLLPPKTGLICCATCMFSDYSPGGHGLLGMLCHRSTKQQYLAVRSKDDYWHVSVTEEVMETHHCDEFQHRIPGTGYRG